jgi:hypothetical protein
MNVLGPVCVPGDYSRVNGLLFRNPVREGLPTIEELIGSVTKRLGIPLRDCTLNGRQSMPIHLCGTEKKRQDRRIPLGCSWKMREMHTSRGRNQNQGLELRW